MDDGSLKLGGGTSALLVGLLCAAAVGGVWSLYDAEQRYLAELPAEVQVDPERFARVVFETAPGVLDTGQTEGAMAAR